MNYVRSNNQSLKYQRPNLKNLIHGLNLSRGSNMVGSTRNCFQFFKIEAGVQLKPVFGRCKPWPKFIKFGHWLHEYMVRLLV